jgi:hypothetical protein
MDDTTAMSAAIGAAAAVRARTSPNPWVGAVLLSPDGALIATGATEPPGGRHAEIVALEAAGDAIVYVRHTDDDPAGTSPAWSAWERLDSAEFDARGFEFRVDLSTEDAAFNIAVSELGIDAEELV